MTKQTEALKLALEALEQLQGGCTDSDDGTVEVITVWCPEVIDAIKEALQSNEQVEPVAWIQKNEQGRLITITQEQLDTLRPEFKWIGDLWKDAAPLYTHPPVPTAQPKDPLDTPLPCDVKIGHVTIRKGVALSVLVARMQVLYDMAQSSMDKPKEPEQEPVAYVPYGVFDAWLDQDWLGVKCFNPNSCDFDNMDVQAIYAWPTAQRKPLTDEQIDFIAAGFAKWMFDPETRQRDCDRAIARAIEAAHGIKE